MPCCEFRDCTQALADSSGAGKLGKTDTKTLRANQMAGQRQVGNAEHLAVAAGGTFCELRFVRNKTFAKPVRGPGTSRNLIRSELLGQPGLHAWHHQWMGVCGSQQEERPSA